VPGQITNSGRWVAPKGGEEELRKALFELRSFLQKSGRVVNCASVGELLDVADDLLLEAVDFVFYRVYLSDSLEGARALGGDAERDMRLVRFACPEDLTVDWDLIDWALKSGEVALFPADDPGGGVQSLVVVPLVGRTLTLGAVLLWVDFDETAFTGHAADMLSIFARSTASALESLELGGQRARAQAFIQHVLESVPMGVFSLDRKGTLTFINGTAEFMLGASRAKALNREYSRGFSDETAGIVRRIIGRLDRGEDPGEEELEGGGGGESRFPLGISGTCLVLTGSHEPAGYVFVVRDLEVTREVTRLRELDAMKDDLLSLVSHELRTPLASIMAYAEALLMEGMVESPEERREYLEVIRGEGERLGRLINDVLGLTKMQAGKMEYHYEAVDFNEVLGHAVNVESAWADKKGLQLVREFGADLPAVKIDRDRIIQVACNLLSNAIKYTDEGGSITVITEVPEPGSDEPPCVELRVIDTGVGIPADQIHKVWSRFEQVENARHHTGGTGLGMPICRQIVEEGHGGRIWLTSEVGIGTIVHCRLPL
jgi:two-component system phosphate regulon sensor histidine kinase PhoR